MAVSSPFGFLLVLVLHIGKFFTRFVYLGYFENPISNNNGFFFKLLPNML